MLVGPRRSLARLPVGSAVGQRPFGIVGSAHQPGLLAAMFNWLKPKRTEAKQPDYSALR